VRADNRIQVASLQRRLASSESKLRSELEKKASEQRVDFTGQAADLQTQQKAQRAGIDKQLAALGTRLNEIAAVSNRLTKLETDARLSIKQSAQIKSELADLNRQVNLLVERWTEAIATGDVASSNQSVDDLDATPDWHAYIEKLSSPSADTRWTAVNALGESKDEAVIPHLIKMLDDRDIFVRVATARIFGDLASELAVEALIDALDDETQSVREVVVESLRTITAQNFRFDPAARESDRERRIKAWREWWKKQA
jgi:HEAT repeat protein